MTEGARPSFKLLPCPFCGGGASHSQGTRNGGKPWYYVECESCAAMAEPELWNQRAFGYPPPAAGNYAAQALLDTTDGELTANSETKR